MSELTLYQDPTCPFCRRVLAFLDQIEKTVPMRDTLRDVEAYRELVVGGGRGTVPCLRIRDGETGETWLYESLDIINYLQNHFE